MTWFGGEIDQGKPFRTGVFMSDWAIIRGMSSWWGGSKGQKGASAGTPTTGGKPSRTLRAQGGGGGGPPRGEGKGKGKGGKDAFPKIDIRYSIFERGLQGGSSKTKVLLYFPSHFTMFALLLRQCAHPP